MRGKTRGTTKPRCLDRESSGFPCRFKVAWRLAAFAFSLCSPACGGLCRQVHFYRRVEPAPTPCAVGALLRCRLGLLRLFAPSPPKRGSAASQSVGNRGETLPRAAAASLKACRLPCRGRRGSAITHRRGGAFLAALRRPCTVRDWRPCRLRAGTV